MKAIIFDMDGVLIDSSEANRISFNSVLKDYGIELSQNRRKREIGTSVKDKIKIWERDFGVKIDAEDFKKRALTKQLELLSDQLKPNPVIDGFIATAKEKGLRVSVATSSTNPRAEIFLTKLGIIDQLDSFLSANDVDKHKPDPELFLTSAKEMEVKASECVVIEDALNGIEAARRAKMKVVGVITSVHGKEELNVADLVIESLAELSVEKLSKLFE
tara:strand:- start:4465 stop:5115 length:651 start_codon:yes stop_codon:yes gene_type:complete